MATAATKSVVEGERKSMGDEECESTKVDHVRESQQLIPGAGVFTLALIGGLLLWAAFPPLGWAPLAWLAPVTWVLLIREEKLTGRRPYLKIYLAGFLHWLVLYQFVRIPHPATFVGWIAMSLYLAAYLPLFIAISRVGVLRLKLPAVVVAPIVWTGLELLRGHLFTGLSMSLIGHTQVNWVQLIQIADLGGAYTVSFLMLFVASCLACMFFPLQGKLSIWPLFPAAAAVAATLIYGGFRLNEPPTIKDDVRVRVALIQGSIDTVFGLTPEQQKQRNEELFQQYRSLTQQALQDESVQLVIWPESMFPVPDIIETDSAALPYDASYADTGLAAEHYALLREAVFLSLGGRESHEPPAVYLMAGTQTRQHYEGGSDDFNTALLFNPSRDLIDRYFKMHRVPFGEFIPFGELFPWLYNFSPNGVGLTAGTEPRVFDIGGLRFAPSICFESTVPHLLNRQLRELANEETPADVLVNITNDGWFLGTSCLDHHFTCSVFRAIEHRRPMVIAANTGFSAFIDGNGRVLQKGPRRDTAFLVADVHRDRRFSVYQATGDAFAGACLLASISLAAIGIWDRRRRQGEK